MNETCDEGSSPLFDPCVTVPEPLVDIIHPTPRRSGTAPTPPSKKQGHAITTSPTQKDYVWTFLYSKNVLQLRRIAKDLQVGQKVSKRLLAERILKRTFPSDNDTYAWDTPNNDFPVSVRQKFQEWMVCKLEDDEWLRAPLKNLGSCASTFESTTRGTGFTVGEYARLIIILATDDTCRSALLASVQERTRTQLD